MKSVLSCFLFAATFFTIAMAATVDCIISELKDVLQTNERLKCAVTNFNSCHGGHLGIAHDIKPLAHIYKLSLELDDKLENMIDDVQCSCDLSKEDSEKLLQVLAPASQPIMDTLNMFKKKHCEFVQAMGPALAHRIVGGTLKRTRCLTMDMLRSIQCRVDSTYKEVISVASGEIDKTFQQVICVY